jgi:hypothetical protein
MYGTVPSEADSEYRLKRWREDRDTVKDTETRADQSHRVLLRRRELQNFNSASASTIPAAGGYRYVPLPPEANSQFQKDDVVVPKNRPKVLRIRNVNYLKQAEVALTE